MNQLPEKVRQVEVDIAQEKGPFNLYALLAREDLWDRWDLVVSAPWAHEADGFTYEYMANSLKRRLEPTDMVRLARVVVLDATEDAVRSFTENYDVEHGKLELDNLDRRFGLPVKFGYLITSRRAA